MAFAPKRGAVHVGLTSKRGKDHRIFYVLTQKIRGTFHANGRPHSLTLRYCATDSFNHRIRVELKLFLVTFSLEKK